MKIAIEGCAHGELEKIYDAIEQVQGKESIKLDLLICCGDFQATRNVHDLQCMAVPQKYQNMCSFYKYYSGEKVAPILTLFIGGNHEASNYLQELPYGGWVAPNIYYMGNSGVVNLGGIRIAGMSGIYKPRDYSKGRYEKPPYTEETKRSVYHIRNLDVFRLKQIKTPIDIFISHDWPRGIYNYGNVKHLLKIKPFFTDEVTNNQLGSQPCEELLFQLKPSYWFAAHLHCKFAALVTHKNEESNPQTTKFLALDKCLPKRKFLQILDIPSDEGKTMDLEYDLEWLSILHTTNHLISIDRTHNYLPGPGGNERYDFTPTEKDLDFMKRKTQGDLKVPHNFVKTTEAFEGGSNPNNKSRFQQYRLPMSTNPQTTTFCDKIGVSDPFKLILDSCGLTPKKNVSQTTLEQNRSCEVNASFEESDISCIYSSGEDLDTSPGGVESPLGDTPSPMAKPRSSIFLPPPKFDLPQANEEDIQDNIINSIQDEALKGEAGNPEEKASNDRPAMKKFKRRNHDLYKNEEDEEEAG